MQKASELATEPSEKWQDCASAQDRRANIDGGPEESNILIESELSADPPWEDRRTLRETLRLLLPIEL